MCDRYWEVGRQCSDEEGNKGVGSRAGPGEERRGNGNAASVNGEGAEQRMDK